MRAEQVVALVRDLEDHGITLWLVGGWGVDALLGEQTREHHDVDVLVDVADLERFVERLHALGFEFAYAWDGETRKVSHESWLANQQLPSAFVYVHPDGREIDTHVLDSADGAEPVPLWNTTHVVPGGGLQAFGVVAGKRVRCISAEMQRLAHEGYELPPKHLRILEFFGWPDARRVPSGDVLPLQSA